jgi:cell division protein FtsB
MKIFGQNDRRPTFLKSRRLCRPGIYAIFVLMPIPDFTSQGELRSNKKRDNSLMQTRGLALLLIFFLFILILAFVFGDRGIIEIVKTQKQIKALQQNIKNLEMEKQKLSREIELLRENPMALEKKARENLWLMKKNEKVVVLIKDKKEIKHE